MCNCMQDTKNQLEKRVKESEKFKNLTDIRVINPNIALIFGEDGKVTSKPYMVFRAEGEYETKSGNVKTKKEDLNVTFTYCPFCGKEI